MIDDFIFAILWFAVVFCVFQFIQVKTDLRKKMETKLEGFVDLYNGLLSSLHTQMCGIKKRLDALEEKERPDVFVELINGRAHNLHTQICHIKERLDTLEEEEKLDNNLAILKGRLDIANAQLETANGKIGMLKSNIEIVSFHLGELEDEVRGGNK